MARWTQFSKFLTKFLIFVYQLICDCGIKIDWTNVSYVEVNSNVFFKGSFVVFTWFEVKVSVYTLFPIP